MGVVREILGKLNCLSSNHSTSPSSPFGSSSGTSNHYVQLDDIQPSAQQRSTSPYTEDRIHSADSGVLEKQRATSQASDIEEERPNTNQAESNMPLHTETNIDGCQNCPISDQGSETSTKPIVPFLNLDALLMISHFLDHEDLMELARTSHYVRDTVSPVLFKFLRTPKVAADDTSPRGPPARLSAFARCFSIHADYDLTHLSWCGTQTIELTGDLLSLLDEDHKRESRRRRFDSIREVSLKWDHIDTMFSVSKCEHLVLTDVKAGDYVPDILKSAAQAQTLKTLTFRNILSDFFVHYGFTRPFYLPSTVRTLRVQNRHKTDAWFMNRSLRILVDQSAVQYSDPVVDPKLLVIDQFGVPRSLVELLRGDRERVSGFSELGSLEDGNDSTQRGRIVRFYCARLSNADSADPESNVPDMIAFQESTFLTERDYYFMSTLDKRAHTTRLIEFSQMINSSHEVDDDDEG